MKLTLLRHTRTAMPSGVCYGQYDAPLAEGFREEAQMLKQRLPEVAFERVISSPRLRCTHLAEALFPDRTLQKEPALLEMHFGTWENKAWNAIDPDALQQWMDDFVNASPPGGENLLTLARRVHAWLDGLDQAREAEWLVVTHAGVLRCVWAWMLELPLENIFKIPVGYGEVLRLQLHPDPARRSILQKA